MCDLAALPDCGVVCTVLYCLQGSGKGPIWRQVAPCNTVLPGPSTAGAATFRTVDVSTAYSSSSGSSNTTTSSSTYSG